MSDILENNYELAGLSDKDRQMTEPKPEDNVAPDDSVEEKVKPEGWTQIPMPEKWRRVREHFKAEIKQNREGLDTGRVEEFIRSQGMEVKDYIVFDKEEEGHVTELLRQHHLLDSSEKCDEAWYSANVDLAFIKRRDYDFATESGLAHELAHASSNHGYFKKGKKIVLNRIGLAILEGDNEDRNASALEEGFAALIANRYTARYITPQDLNLLAQAAGMEPEAEPFGPGDVKITVQNSATQRQHDIALEHWYITPDGNLAWVDSIFAGEALGLLCEKDPELFPALVRSRTSVDGLREVAARIDNISPGLYPKLSGLGYSKGLEALEITKDALHKQHKLL